MCVDVFARTVWGILQTDLPKISTHIINSEEMAASHLGLHNTGQRSASSHRTAVCRAIHQTTVAKYPLNIDIYIYI
jgi:hypothetical protein